MTDPELTVKEHNENIAAAERDLAAAKAAAADVKFPKFPELDLIKEHEENVAERERALVQAKAAALFPKEAEAQVTLKEREERVAVAERELAEARAAAAHEEFPKYIEPDASHIVEIPARGDAPAHKSVPMFQIGRAHV
jgi:hypothetical protein